MLKVGSVPYLVGRPLDEGLGSEPGISFGYAVPSRLVAMLREGALDVALVSSIELFRRPGYVFLDGLCVAGEGVVSSVQVFLRRPLEAVRRVALDPASRTSVALSQIVWPSARESSDPSDSGDSATGRPEFFELSEGQAPDSSDADAFLEIGDAALRRTFGAAAPAVFNPSQEWARRTGLPFVFAAWIAREEAPLAPHLDAFARARARGRERLEELAAQAAERWNLAPEVTRRYLAEECLYEPGPRQGAALRAFRDRAAELGLAQGSLSPGAVPIAVD